MKGRRLALTEDGKLPSFGSFEPGDYAGPVMGYTGNHENGQPRVAVFFLLPIARDEEVPHPGARAFHHVASPPHVFRECPDGSLEIRESIGCGFPTFYWHGYLDEGHEWRV